MYDTIWRGSGDSMTQAMIQFTTSSASHNHQNLVQPLAPVGPSLRRCLEAGSPNPSTRHGCRCGRSPACFRSHAAGVLWSWVA